MISLRQHTISLAAVFLALAVGVVLGSGFLSDTLLSSLRDEKRDLHTQINGLNDQKNALTQKLSAANNFDRQLAGRMMRDALSGKSIVLFRTPDAKDDDIAAVSRNVTDAGGTVVGTVSLTQEFVEANAAEKLLTVVNSSILPAGTQLSTKLVDQGSQAGDLLGIALLINANPSAPVIPEVPETQRATVLAALRDSGFITYQPSDHFGAANAAIVITGGGLASDAGNQGASVARFAAALAPHGSGTLLAGRDGSATGTAAVAVTRADGGMASTISTVDDVDSEAGRITAILGLHELINGGHPGQYGTGHAATSITVPN
jgi:Copper transport outer membrane protein, MctB